MEIAQKEENGIVSISIIDRRWNFFIENLIFLSINHARIEWQKKLVGF